MTTLRLLHQSRSNMDTMARWSLDGCRWRLSATTEENIKIPEINTFTSAPITC
jgi:hypothetical protein